MTFQGSCLVKFQLIKDDPQAIVPLSTIAEEDCMSDVGQVDPTLADLENISPNIEEVSKEDVHKTIFRS